MDLFYNLKATEVKKGEVPDWKRSGYKVASDLIISTKESDSVEEALRIAEVIVKKYNGILYDSIVEQYFRKEDL